MAITEPAKKAGSVVDDDLIGLLLAEMRTGQPGTSGAGVLPLLSHALDQAWRSRTGHTLTLADYERTGGIDGAVAASAQTGVSAVAFSPDGTLLTSADGDGTVRLWQVSLYTHPYAALCAYVGPPTPQEWNQYASGEPQPKACG